MKIRFTPEIAIQLETCAVQAAGLEFSGLGFVRVDKAAQEFVIYKFFPLHMGSGTYTVIDPKKILPILEEPDAQNLKAWVHRHPVGDGKPGIHNWSGTDNATIRDEPLGGNPILVQWSISVVRTPMGWVGRVDNHITGKTEHLEVIGQGLPETYQVMATLSAEYYQNNSHTRYPYDRPMATFGDDLYVQGVFEDLEMDEEESDDSYYTEHFAGQIDDLIQDIEDFDAEEDEELIPTYQNDIDDLNYDIEDTFGTVPNIITKKLAELDAAWSKKVKQPCL